MENGPLYRRHGSSGDLVLPWLLTMVDRLGLILDGQGAIPTSAIGTERFINNEQAVAQKWWLCSSSGTATVPTVLTPRSSSIFGLEAKRIRESVYLNFMVQTQPATGQESYQEVCLKGGKISLFHTTISTFCLS